MRVCWSFDISQHEMGWLMEAGPRDLAASIWLNRELLDVGASQLMWAEKRIVSKSFVEVKNYMRVILEGK